ncbi:MAG: hypothetical protein H5T61_09005 [Thermoflexales bacterium]|nr:hypothetical protein [Thermoflexales bacterium]
MITDLKLIWLRRVLFVKALLTLLAWGLPALLGPLSLLAILRVPIPEDPIYLRLFGGACTAFGVAYWLAYRDPVRNVAIVKAGLADNGLITLVILFLGLTGNMSSAFIWLSGFLTGLFFLLFLFLIPRQEQPAAR